jgi:hypothetical protein
MKDRTYRRKTHIKTAYLQTGQVHSICWPPIPLLPTLESKTNGRQSDNGRQSEVLRLPRYACHPLLGKEREHQRGYQRHM